jgi:hypothetical protein
VGPETNLVAHIFDSGLYMAAPGEGGLIPHCRRIDGSYHMDGDLVLLPKDLQYDLFKQLASELDNYKKNPVIFVAPLPRYLEEGCCGDKDHMKNRREPDFAQKLEKGVFEVRTNIKNSAFRHGFRRAVTLSAWGKVRKMEKLWSDPIHLVDEGYKILAEAVTEARDDLKKKRQGVEMNGLPPAKNIKTSATLADGAKRGHPEAGQRGQRRRGAARGRGGGLSEPYMAGPGLYTDGFEYYHRSEPGWNAWTRRGGSRGQARGQARGQPHYYHTRGRGALRF